MADPCVTDTAYIDLETTGTPAVLSATLRNPEESFSGTQGDDTVHNVSDNNVQHSMTQTWNISNAGGSAPCRGIVVVAINPIWVAAVDPITVVPFSRLTVGGVIADDRDVAATGIDIPAGTTQLLLDLLQAAARSVVSDVADG